VKILISWSGKLSHSLAVALHDWIPVVLPFAVPWVSSEDIPKGSRWGAQLSAELDATNCGLICITPDNLQEPWLNFEAGALSKSVEESRVHLFLLAVSPSQLSDGPLSQFQATEPTKDEVRKLVRAINQFAGDAKLPFEQLDRNFATCWPDLERRLAPLLKLARTPASAIAERTTQADLPTSDDLGELDLKALRLVADADESMFPRELAAILGVHPERATHIMETLEARHLLSPSHNYLYGTSWSLSKAGRAELVKRKLL
jgi:hypothetical protein